MSEFDERDILLDLSRIRRFGRWLRGPEERRVGRDVVSRPLFFKPNPELSIEHVFVNFTSCQLRLSEKSRQNNRSNSISSSFEFHMATITCWCGSFIAHWPDFNCGSFGFWISPWCPVGGRCIILLIVAFWFMLVSSTSKMVPWSADHFFPPSAFSISTGVPGWWLSHPFDRGFLVHAFFFDSRNGSFWGVLDN